MYAFKSLCDVLHNDLPKKYALVAKHIIYMYLYYVIAYYIQLLSLTYAIFYDKWLAQYFAQNSKQAYLSP